MLAECDLHGQIPVTIQYTANMQICISIGHPAVLSGCVPIFDYSEGEAMLVEIEHPQDCLSVIHSVLAELMSESERTEIGGPEDYHEKSLFVAKDAHTHRLEVCLAFVVILR